MFSAGWTYCGYPLMLNSIIPWLSVTVEIVKQMKLQSSDLQTKNLKTQKTGVGTNVLGVAN